MRENETTLTVRYNETDQMGIVHHGQYINWFEVGRTDFIQKMGRSYRQLEEEGAWLPVIAAHVDYSSPAKFEDKIMITTKIGKYNGVRLTFEYQVSKIEDGAEIVSGYTEHCWTDENLKPVPLKRLNTDLHEKLSEATEAK